MKHFTVSINHTKAGSILVVSEDAQGKRVTHYVIKKHSDAETVDGKGPFKGEDLAKALRLQVLHRERMKEQGGVDLDEPIGPLADLFFKEREGRKLDPGTLYNVRHAVEVFLSETKIETLGVFADRKLSRKKLLDWRGDLVRKGMKAGSIRGIITNAKVFTNWLVENDYLGKDPFGKKVLPEKEASDPKFFTREEFRLLDEAYVALDEPVARLGMNLCYSAGLRIGEVVGDREGTHHGVFWEDVVWLPDGSAELVVPARISKTKKGRSVPLDSYILGMMGSRRSGPIVPMERGRFETRFIKARRKAGLDAKKYSKHLTFHGTRHSFATNYVQTSGKPLSALQELLGHESIVTTQVYSKHEHKDHREGIERVLKRRLEEESIASRERNPGPSELEIFTPVNTSKLRDSATGK